MSSLAWPEHALPEDLPEDAIHVWAWLLERDGESENGAPGCSPLSDHISLLDDHELSRMGRLRMARDRSAFAIAHGNMRRILAGYLCRPPASLRFRNDSLGKPELSEDGPTIHFNLSHSRRVALLACSAGSPVGVDVEDLAPIDPALAQSYFSQRELSALQPLKGDAWLAAFYRCWTRKEAILKAEGVGLRIPLDAFDVSLLADEPPLLLESRPAARLRRMWRLYHLEPAAGVIGALAARQEELKISCFTLPV